MRTGMGTRSSKSSSCRLPNLRQLRFDFLHTVRRTELRQLLQFHSPPSLLMERLENAQAGPGFFERFAGIAAPIAGIYGASMPGGSKLLFPLINFQWAA